MTKSKTSSWTAVAGKEYNMPEFEFVPTGTEIGIEISSAQDLIDFATAYNAEEYYDLGYSLVVNISGDLSFDADLSADFNATGGIGTPDSTKGDTNYFNGVLNGNGHTISGLIATVPVVAYTGSGGIVKNLTLSSTCSYTIDSPASLAFHGALVGRNKGTVKDCTSNANVVINNIQDVSSASQYYGGLVGYNPGGAIDGCTMAGNITCSQTGQTITEKNSKYASIGGIAGYQSDVAGATINNCTFTGNITISDATTYGGITANMDYFYVGGIIGRAEKAVVSNCTAGIDGTPTSIDVRGQFVSAIGGIIGWEAAAANSEIRDCQNYMSLSFNSDGARANTTPTRLGGIAGRSAATIKDCTNNGAISSKCNSTTHYLAGIVADGANVKNCTNSSTGTVTRSNADQITDQANRYIYLAGILATTNASCDVDNCDNYALIKNNVPGTATATTVDMGGIVAGALHQIDITNCENHGNVTATETTNTVATTRVALGGIVGFCKAANSTIVKCINANQIYCEYNSSNKANNRRSYIGGIAGMMANFVSTSNISGLEGLEIDQCTNTGAIWSRNYNNSYALTTGAFGGGIVGVIIGTDKSRASVHDCDSSTGRLTDYRGIVAGISAYAEYSTLEDNTASNEITANKSAEGCGGVAGILVHSSMTNCTYSGAVTASGGSAPLKVGGLVYSIDEDSSITNSNVNGATLIKGSNEAATEPAVLASIAADGATITGSGVKGTLKGDPITLSSNMITTDGGATVTGTYLLP